MSLFLFKTIIKRDFNLHIWISVCVAINTILVWKYKLLCVGYKLCITHSNLLIAMYTKPVRWKSEFNPYYHKQYRHQFNGRITEITILNENDFIVTYLTSNSHYQIIY